MELIMNVQESRAERKKENKVSHLDQLGRLGWTVCYPLRERNEGKVRGKIERRNNRASTTQPVQPRLDWTLYSAVLCSVKCSVQWRPPWM